jgi:hypothetical protein
VRSLIQGHSLSLQIFPLHGNHKVTRSVPWSGSWRATPRWLADQQHPQQVKPSSRHGGYHAPVGERIGPRGRRQWRKQTCRVIAPCAHVGSGHSDAVHSWQV